MACCPPCKAHSLPCHSPVINEGLWVGAFVSVLIEGLSLYLTRHGTRLSAQGGDFSGELERAKAWD